MEGSHIGIKQLPIDFPTLQTKTSRRRQLPQLAEPLECRARCRGLDSILCLTVITRTNAKGINTPEKWKQPALSMTFERADVWVALMTTEKNSIFKWWLCCSIHWRLNKCLQCFAASFLGILYFVLFKVHISCWKTRFLSGRLQSILGWSKAYPPHAISHGNASHCTSRFHWCS